MVSWQVTLAIAAGSVFTAGIVCAGVVWLSRLVRAASPVGITPSSPDLGSSVPSNMDVTVLRVLSERVAILEGSLPALQQTLNGYGALAARVADMEARLPTVAEAHDRFATISLNIEKRRLETERRAEKKRAQEDPDEITVAEAAAQMGLAGDAEAAEAAAAEAKPTGKRPGVYGQGGNSGRR